MLPLASWFFQSALRTLLRAIFTVYTSINNLNNLYISSKNEHSSPHTDTRLRQLSIKTSKRSDTYKFFQNWLRVSAMLIKSLSMALKKNCFMILMIICEYFAYLLYCLNQRFNIDLLTFKNSILFKLRRSSCFGISKTLKKCIYLENIIVYIRSFNAWFFINYDLINDIF